jgi:hypothetical protein
MVVKKMEWMLSGDCTEACTSPPVYPYYWGSSAPADLHEGKNQCEGTFTVHSKTGYYGETDLKDLEVSVPSRKEGGNWEVTNPPRRYSLLDILLSRAFTGSADAIQAGAYRRVVQQ